MERKYEFYNGYIIESHKSKELIWKFILSLYPNEEDNLNQLRKEVIDMLPPTNIYMIPSPFHVVVGEKDDASNLSH
tara:strand:- start:9942 stop:10169 length:228 start_codon:yes stop_codon:yes gene_type:complete